MPDDVIDADKLDPGFKTEISKQPGGENMKLCFQCGPAAAPARCGPSTTSTIRAG